MRDPAAFEPVMPHTKFRPIGPVIPGGSEVRPGIQPFRPAAEGALDSPSAAQSPSVQYQIELLEFLTQARKSFNWLVQFLVKIRKLCYAFSLRRIEAASSAPSRRVRGARGALHDQGEKTLFESAVTH